MPEEERSGELRKAGHEWKNMLLGAALALVAGCCGVGTTEADSQPLIRIGVLSDTQSYPDENNHGQLFLKEALASLHKAQIDVLIYGGDISDNGNPHVYADYREIMRNEFGSTPPEQILIMGNHDYWNGLPAGEARKNFARNIGQESPDVHKEIKGFTFIGLSPEDGSLHGTYTAGKSGKFLAPILEKAHREQPGKPVFIVTHHPPRNTVYGADDWGNSDLVELFRNYPEIVNFSGHTHYSIEDERAIFQQDFTAVASQSLSYAELESGKTPGTVPAYGGDEGRYLIVDVYPERMEIRRFDKNGEEVKPEARWVLPLPLARKSFRYTAERAARRGAPEFPGGSECGIYFPSEPFDKALLTFDAAKHEDFVHSYALVLEKRNPSGNFEPAGEILFFSDFPQGINRMLARPLFEIPGEKLEANTEYRAKLYAIESFGKRSSIPLECGFTTPEKKSGRN